VIDTRAVAAQISSTKEVRRLSEPQGRFPFRHESRGLDNGSSLGRPEICAWNPADFAKITHEGGMNDSATRCSPKCKPLSSAGNLDTTTEGSALRTQRTKPNLVWTWTRSFHSGDGFHPFHNRQQSQSFHSGIVLGADSANSEGWNLVRPYPNSYVGQVRGIAVCMYEAVTRREQEQGRR